jgi:hypothetical protein
MPDDALFDPPPGFVPPPAPGMSADRRRTVRQARALAAGVHPLGIAFDRHLPLHPDAAPADDRQADGLRCGTCRFREVLGHHSRSYPKCTHGGGTRISHGAGTDCRAHWPACRDHLPREETT